MGSPESGLSSASFFVKGQRFLFALTQRDLANMEVRPHAGPGLWESRGHVGGQGDRVPAPRTQTFPVASP